MEITEEQAAGMSREEAIRTLAAMGDRRAQLMLAGPAITGPVARPRLDPMVLAVRVALLQLGDEVRDERQAAKAEVAELAGMRG